MINYSLNWTLLVGICSMLLSKATAQTFTTLYTFAPGAVDPTTGLYTNSDGASPMGLVLASNTLYGLTGGGLGPGSGGGALGHGAIFRINTDGTGFTNLYNLDGDNDGSLVATITSGGNEYAPYASALVLSGDRLYGTAQLGGTANEGTVFAINTDGTDFTVLHAFSATSYYYSTYTNTDGAQPQCTLVLSGNTLFGTTLWAGPRGEGTVFAVDTDGSNFRIIHAFAIGGGQGPAGSLVLSGDTLYGTSWEGPTNAGGAFFAVRTNGTGFSFRHDGGGTENGPLVLSGATLYGNAGYGWFAISTSGTGLRYLSTSGNAVAMILSGNKIYLTDNNSNSSNMVCAINTDGTGFSNLHMFFGGAYDPTGRYTNRDGYLPAGLILSGNTLYGSTMRGGTTGGGTIFSITLPPPPPQLFIIPDGSGGFFINARSQGTFTCQLQRASILTGPWSSSAPQTSDSSGLVQFHDLFPPSDRAFYRTVQQ